MSITPATLAELVIAISFAAGLNVYATVATLGLMARMQWVTLPSGLDVLTNQWVIGAAVALFAVEFFADKIPGFDLVWNAAHTLVRIPVAALLAYGATTHLSPGLQALAVAVGAALATVAHGSKLAARVMVTPSPEPVSNMALSAAEDAGAIGLTWVATHHPLAGALLVAAAVIVAVALTRWIIQAMRTWWRHLWTPAPSHPVTEIVAQSR